MAKISHSSIDENSQIEEHMGLIITVAKSFNPSPYHSLDDYIQAGRIGLLKAIRSYDPLRSSFPTSAWHHIRWAISSYIENESVEPVLPITVEPSGDNHESISDYLPNTLSDRERDVVILRSQGHTFKDIGKKYGFSKSWANYTFHSGVQKIQDANGNIYD